MKFFNRLFRLIRINFILMRFNIDEIILDNHRFSPLRFIAYFNPYSWSKRQTYTRGERVRLALEALGPIYVKMGQILSTRRDILPDDIATELAKLQDCVPPFSGVVAKSMIEASLGCRIEECFKEFDMNALASASIAQVHAATLPNDESVVIKVLRPNIAQIIKSDIDLLLSLAKLAERYSSRLSQFKPQQLILEIAQTLYDELDLMREAANASQLRRNFAGSPYLYVPKIHWNYTRENIMVMERIYGIPIYDITRLKEARVNLRKLAERGIEVFFTQIFRDSFFHADLHPGNLFVSDKDPENPSFLIVDFGIVGSLSHEDQRYIAENMIAFFKRDYQRVAELHIACGWLPPETRIDQFEGAVRAVSEPVLERPLKDVSFGQLLLRLFQVARRFHINIQPQLILLQKTLLSIESLSRTLAPELDLWGTAAPQIEKWLKRQVGVKAFLRRVKENLPLWSEQLPEMPSLLFEVLRETKQKQEFERFNLASTLKEEEKHLTSLRRRYFISGFIVAAFIAVMAFFFM